MVVVGVALFVFANTHRQTKWNMVQLLHQHFKHQHLNKIFHFAINRPPTFDAVGDTPPVLPLPHRRCPTFVGALLRCRRCLPEAEWEGDVTCGPLKQEMARGGWVGRWVGRWAGRWVGRWPRRMKVVVAGGMRGGGYSCVARLSHKARVM